MEEVNLVARILAETLHARKINYELLGNQLPHIHWHLIPRLADDPTPLEPVWRVPHHPVHLMASELQERLRFISAEIDKQRPRIFSPPPA
jgi:diadenosine tetraphosphate (Ap4A) HIT family hydrolase